MPFWFFPIEFLHVLQWVLAVVFYFFNPEENLMITQSYFHNTGHRLSVILHEALYSVLLLEFHTCSRFKDSKW